MFLQLWLLVQSRCTASPAVGAISSQSRHLFFRVLWFVAPILFIHSFRFSSFFVFRVSAALVAVFFSILLCSAFSRRSGPRRPYVLRPMSYADVFHFHSRAYYFEVIHVCVKSRRLSWIPFVFSPLPQYPHLYPYSSIPSPRCRYKKPPSSREFWSGPFHPPLLLCFLHIHACEARARGSCTHSDKAGPWGYP